ncbi:lipoprotein [Jeotgalicoccus coquinae]|uniref:Protein SCO1/2 n=1 Tax=Jeotgalicoccus coquinae TaxID=709509 RepID=A0A6V7R951_9STAP|nr:SCO family protein [Jeotgalicoccus coquinae]MBB6422844.1 protein SCO1/2 [Jeotgalicoccus coquinae]GGE12759.1 lipoprotein [Jeotgalicoccus coquinae]CAD2073959.1 SCO1 protein [Jeotgalicoccus coquinae]
MFRSSLLIALVLLLTACGSSEVEPMSYYGNTLEKFEAVNQHNETFTSEDMDGKVWLANLIFTQCVTVCPPMTQNMTELTQELEKADLENVGIVSFSVDPDTDTPEVLSEYMSWYSPSETIEWQLLTGYEFEYLRDYALNNFKSIVKLPQDGSNQVLHGTAIYLIDENGKLVKDYTGIDAGDNTFETEQIVKDVKTMTSNME